MHDIPDFNKHYSTKLEEWLIDIEMAVDLTSESKAMLAKVQNHKV